ncbi:hypothetical protein QE152_g37585 [Popillia japonica]|uniref:Uncharacterized protein n=1 Tax=Popillia japonica TaxID=7064 RepID=A0AAW1I9P8_POPJA
MLDLQQCNNILNTNRKVLDLVLTSAIVTVSITPTNYVLAPEDAYHPALDIVIDDETELRPPNFPRSGAPSFNFRNVDFGLLCDALIEEDWSWINKYNNVNLAVNNFYDQLNGVFEPKQGTLRYSSTFPVWFSPEIRRNIKTKDFYRRKWLATKC